MKKISLEKIVIDSLKSYFINFLCATKAYNLMQNVTLLLDDKSMWFSFEKSYASAIYKQNECYVTLSTYEELTYPGKHRDWGIWFFQNSPGTNLAFSLHSFTSVKKEVMKAWIFLTELSLPMNQVVFLDVFPYSGNIIHKNLYPRHPSRQTHTYQSWHTLDYDISRDFNHANF